MATVEVYLSKDDVADVIVEIDGSPIVLFDYDTFSEFPEDACAEAQEALSKALDGYVLTRKKPTLRNLADALDSFVED